MSGVSAITGYTDFERGEDGQLTAIAHREDGSQERTGVRLVVERQIVRDGVVIADGEVASSDDGSVTVADGAQL